MLSWLENSLIFPAPRPAVGPWSPGLGAEDVEFRAADGVRLHGRFVPHPNPKATVVYFHGNGDCLEYLGEYAEFLRAVLGASVLYFDYRGYGRSEGRPDERGVLADGRAAVAWLSERANRAPDQLVLLGRSLGGAVAIDVAVEHGARALVLECTFTSMPDVVASLYPWLPLRWLLRTRLNSLAKIGGYRGPVLQLHGARDELVPLALAQRLHAAIPGPKRLVIDPGGHNLQPTLEYYQALARFVAQPTHRAETGKQP